MAHPFHKTSRWQRMRARHLTAEPLCRMCRAEGYTVAAMVCDHVEPHRGNTMLFFDERNLQSLCFRHHDSDKQRLEKGGRIIGIDGWPVN